MTSGEGEVVADDGFDVAGGLVLVGGAQAAAVVDAGEEVGVGQVAVGGGGGWFAVVGDEVLEAAEGVEAVVDVVGLGAAVEADAGGASGDGRGGGGVVAVEGAESGGPATDVRSKVSEVSWRVSE